VAGAVKSHPRENGRLLMSTGAEVQVRTLSACRGGLMAGMLTWAMSVFVTALGVRAWRGGVAFVALSLAAGGAAALGPATSLLALTMASPNPCLNAEGALTAC
jgi:hypothetical protein